MQLIKIHYNPSLPVGNFEAIRDQAEEMGKILLSKEYGFSLHHAYVSEKPLNFFVLNDVVLQEFVQKLGSRYIINPEIKSFVKASVMAVPEGCIAFPYRSPKKVQRAMLLKVSYDIPDPMSKNGLKRIEGMEVDRIIAQIFQHEIDHANGKNIYFDKPKV